jgi:hypothetical protein
MMQTRRNNNLPSQLVKDPKGLDALGLHPAVAKVPGT